MTNGIRILVKSSIDIIRAREAGRSLAKDLGFSSSDATLVVTAISELARNIVLYAGEGEICLRRADEGKRGGITIVARDEGPGIPNVAQVLHGGFSTSGGLGLGLSGTRRIMDEFDIVTNKGSGTTVTATKWTAKRRLSLG